GWHADRTMTTPKVPAADATLRLLTFLASRRSPVPAARIAAELGLPRSRTYDLLSTLVEHGYVLHLDQERAYGLGPAAHELSGAYLRQEPLARIGRRVIEAMVDEVGESGHLAVLHGRDVLYIVEERARNRPSLVTDVGVRLSAHLTASGRAARPVRHPGGLPLPHRRARPRRSPRPARAAHPGAGRRDRARVRRGHRAAVLGRGGGARPCGLARGLGRAHLRGGAHLARGA